MLSEYLKEKNISIYSISKCAKLPYSTLNDLCNGKVEIDNCKVGLLMKLSEALNLDVKDLYKICKSQDYEIQVEPFKISAHLKIKNKKYYLEYFQDDELVCIPLFKVNETNSKFVKEAAEWVLEDRLIEREMEELYAIQSNEK